MSINATPRTYSTAELAELFHVKPGTIRRSLCMRGSYLGLRPVKQANRLLGWNADQADSLARGETPQQGGAGHD